MALHYETPCSFLCFPRGQLNHSQGGALCILMSKSVSAWTPAPRSVTSSPYAAQCTSEAQQCEIKARLLRCFRFMFFFTFFNLSS